MFFIFSQWPIKLTCAYHYIVNYKFLFNLHSSSKIIQSDSLSVRSGNSSLQSSESGSSGFQISCHSNEDSFDSSVSTSTNSSSCIINNNNNNSPTKIDEDEPEIVSERLMLEQELMAAKDTQLLQLLADMNKMKRRCKHILDVTDRYCVLRPGKKCQVVEWNSEPNLDQSYTTFKRLFWFLTQLIWLS